MWLPGLRILLCASGDICSQSQSLCGRCPETLEKLAELGRQSGVWLVIWRLVIVRAPSQCDVGLISRNLGVKVSAFVPLDEEAEVLLWIDDFNSGVLAGQPAGPASVLCWMSGTKLRLSAYADGFTRNERDAGAAGPEPLPWFGRWHTDGTLEINTRHFDTLELDAEELEELLR